MLWPDDIQDEVNLHPDWCPAMLDDDEAHAPWSRVEERFGIIDGRIESVQDLLEDLDRFLRAPVTVHWTDLLGGESTLHLWCSIVASRGTFLATQAEMRPVLETLIDGARRFAARVA